MQGKSGRIGWALAFEFMPAAIFGGSVGFSAATFLAEPLLGVTPLAAGAGAFGCAWLGLRKFGTPKEQFSLSDFEEPRVEYQPSAVSELLEQADVVAIVEQLRAGDDQKGPDELVLDDVLTAIEQDSRVVRLFEPRDTAGEMHSRIEKHLQSSPRQTPPDATQELYDALAALRRSLR